jgi:hypothetical protein
MHIYPYVYRLDHPVTGEFYIGYRCANKVSSAEDLGHIYFTSSKIVKPRFHEFTYQIIAEFFDKNDAYDFEQQLISDNFKNPNILNRLVHRKFGISWLSNPKTVYSHLCPFCNSEFKNNNRDSKYCSRACKEAQQSIDYKLRPGHKHTEQYKKTMSDTHWMKRLDRDHPRQKYVYVNGLLETTKSLPQKYGLSENKWRVLIYQYVDKCPIKPPRYKNCEPKERFDIIGFTVSSSPLNLSL